MKLLKFALIVLVGFSLTAFSRPAAKAQLKDSKGNPAGQALFSEDENGVKMQVEASGLSAGLHGMHIHAVGKCEAPDFKTAGPHFNPEGKKHGVKNPEGHHHGDLPNLTADDQGNAKAEITLENLTLKEGVENSLFHEGGTSVVIHASADDEMTDPAGNSGGRIICGVVEKV